MRKQVKTSRHKPREPFPVSVSVVLVHDDDTTKTLHSLGVARNQEELNSKKQQGERLINPDQLTLFDIATSQPVDLEGVYSKPVLWGLIEQAYTALGFHALGDDVFKQMVVARVIEPSSVQGITEICLDGGVEPFHRNTYQAALKRARKKGYQQRLEAFCAAFSGAQHDVPLLLFDATTLYSESKEDEFRRVGYSKERRVDPQVVVSLLTDQAGFPLTMQSFPGNTGETTTFLPMVTRYVQRFDRDGRMVVVADAAMLSNHNLEGLDQVGARFIVGSKQTHATRDIADYFARGVVPEDGLLLERSVFRDRRRRSGPTPERVWNGDGDTWRSVWAYSEKRARKDLRSIAKAEERALAFYHGEKTRKKTKYLKTAKNHEVSIDYETINRDQMIAGFKGYVTNLKARDCSPSQVVGWYHMLWQIESSFRLSKHTLEARPFYHRKKKYIEAHLTVVFASLAVARFIQQVTGVSISRFVRLVGREIQMDTSYEGKPLVVHARTSDETKKIVERFHDYFQ